MSPISDVKTITSLPEASIVVNKYHTVFDGQIRTIQREEFRICLAANAKPFCALTPRTKPFAYRDKLKAAQNVIASVTEATT